MSEQPIAMWVVSSFCPGKMESARVIVTVSGRADLPTDKNVVIETIKKGTGGDCTGFFFVAVAYRDGDGPDDFLRRVKEEFNGIGISQEEKSAISEVFYWRIARMLYDAGFFKSPAETN